MGTQSSCPCSHSSTESRVSRDSNSPKPQWDAVVDVAELRWWELEIPSGVVVVRKELREMSRNEQDRFARAMLKMRQNRDRPGTSPFFELAAYHGGFPPVPRADLPEYCTHGNPAFPTWHRGYMLEFERMLRRADMALGGDGNIGLPYWNWSKTRINGEVLPDVVRRELLSREFERDFLPTPPARDFRLAATNSDAQIGAQIEQGRIAHMAYASQHSIHWLQFASTSDASSRAPTIESPHNSIHMFVGGLMGSFQSSFHPVFWLHHCNVDRCFETYISHETDSLVEFERQHRRQARIQKGAGFPEGAFGPYPPFKNPNTGRTLHARDCFDCPSLGYSYDQLDPIIPPEMREPPYLVIFPKVDVKKLKHTYTLYVFVHSALDQFVPPTDVTPEAMANHPYFAGIGSIFFLNLPEGCENCAQRPAFDVIVDVTKVMHKQKLMPKQVKIACITADEEGVVAPVEQTPVPLPVFQGPRFSSLEDIYDKDKGHADDITALQELLARRKYHIMHGEMEQGKYCDNTEGAIYKLQKAAGLPESGRADIATRKALVHAVGMFEDKVLAERLQVGPGDTVQWYVDESTLPCYLRLESVAKDLETAFSQWEEASNIKFNRTEKANDAKVTISWADHTSKNEFHFDGPGGALAEARPDAIVFDSSERWEVTGAEHKHRQHLPWDELYFKLLPVALHEIGHVLGLDHSDNPIDVMSPFYLADRAQLSAEDKVRIKVLLGILDLQDVAGETPSAAPAESAPADSAAPSSDSPENKTSHLPDEEPHQPAAEALQKKKGRCCTVQ
eukprot:TRINITY_DN44750_c0_g1_i1.p1 TRINITY_DN44750_c0_g1~~TRINITY_DN44750_c0_g1_i1.p1  ORF type:complete len:803 (-),score=137.81 TRINITY_DN44750_c0_g1_i1:402-2771(-)